MAKQEDSKLNKLKHFLGIGGTKGGSLNLENVKPPTKDFVITNDILNDISPNSPIGARMKRLNELCETVLTRRLEDNAVEAIWQCTSDLLRESVAAEDRHLMLKFLQCLIKGQYTHLGIMRAHFFRVIKGHTLFEDVALRLDLFKVLSCEGKDLEYFEEETGTFLLEWMRDIISSSKVSDFLLLLINVTKFNAAHIDEEIMSGLVINTCLIATQTSLEADVELCLRVLDTVVCYSYLPTESLHQFIVCLCRIVNLEKFCQETWALMRKLLGTHLGHSGIYTMCCILQDKNNITESGASLLRGAVFFVGMALWGSKKITTLRHPPSVVLPAFYQAISHSDSPKVAHEVVLNIQRLVSKYGKDQQMATWDIILDMIEIVLSRAEPSSNHNDVIRFNMHTLLTNIETLNEQGFFNGCSDRFFGIIEKCSYKRPESSILALVSHKAEAIDPSADNWIKLLNDIVDRYFRQEQRSQIRVKVLDVLNDVFFSHRHLYEDEMIELVVLPNLVHIEDDHDGEVKKRSAQLLVEIVIACQTERCLDILQLIRKMLNRPFVTPAQAVQEGFDPRKPQFDFQDVFIAASGLIGAFKSKLYQSPSCHAQEIYDILVTHIEHHYNNSHVLLQTGPIRQAIFSCLLDLRADNLQRLGLPDKSGHLSYSSYFTCAKRPVMETIVSVGALSGTSSPPTASSIPSFCKPTVLPYSMTFCCVRKCIEDEIDWNVIKVLLDKLPLVLQNKSLILASNSEDVERFCSRLCIILSDKNVGFPEKLINAPSKFSKSDFHGFIFPTLTCLVAYNTSFEKSRQRELLKCLEFGLVSRCARICVRALTVCSLEMQEVMLRQLPAVLLKLSQISATVAMAIPLMEFLSSLIHLPQLYSNFVEEQYMSIFAIALPYTNPFKYNHYTVSLAYHVISMWFLKCRMPFRKGFVGFIVKGLQSNVLRQFEDAAVLRMKIQNQDSSERTRAQTLNDGGLLRSKVKAAASKARSGLVTGAVGQDEGMSSFHKELTETCIDMLARYTFSTCSTLPKRSPVEKFLLDGGQCQSWLLGNKIITITTSGGSKVGKAGLCEKCLTMARVATRQSPKVEEPIQPAPSSGRKRHKSAAVFTKTEAVAIRPRSQDDIQLYRPESRESLQSSDGEMTIRRSGSLSSREDLKDSEHQRQATLETRKEKIDAMDSVLLGLKAKPSDRSIFSPQTCNCWCTLWAEVHIRRPTGNFSWMMRIQNEQDLAEFFPDFSLNDISNLLISAPDNAYDMLTGNKIDGHSLEETEYETLLEEHFHGNGSLSTLPHMLLSQELIPEEDECVVTLSGEVNSAGEFMVLNDDSGMKKSTSTPDLTPAQSQRLQVGRSSNSDLQQAFMRSQDFNADEPADTKASTCSETQIAEEDIQVKGDTKQPVGDREGATTVSTAPGEDSTQSEQRSTQSEQSLTTETATKGKGLPQSLSQGSARPISLDPVKPPQRKGHTTGMGAAMDVVQGGINPSFLFLQLYHAHMFGSEERPLRLPQTEVVSRAIKLLDLIYPYETHKLGVIYVGPGQTSDQTGILSNVYGTPRYMEFLHGLGHLVRLRDCDPSSVFLGGLDQKGNDGLFACAWHDEFVQVIYHVATLMPNKESDPNCNAKKLHIGNDYVTIVYNDSMENYKIGVIKGQFNYVNVVISPLDHGMNAVTVQTKDDIEELIGHTDTKIISDANLAVLVRQMALHADLASTILQKQKSNPKDPYASNWLERLRQVKRLRSKVLSESQASSHPSSPILEDFTDFV